MPTTCRRGSASPTRPAIGRTVIRASGGLYFDRIPLRATSNALQRDGTKYQTAQLRSDRLARRPFQPSCRRFRRTPDRDDDDQPRDRGWPQRTGLRRSGPRDRTTAGRHRRLQLRARTRHHHVAQRERADADRRAGCRARHPEPRPAQSELRQHQSIRCARRFVVRRPDCVVDDSLHTAGDALACPHSFERDRRRRQRVLPARRRTTSTSSATRDRRTTISATGIVVSGTFGDGASARLRRALGGVQIGYVFSHGRRCRSTSSPAAIGTTTRRSTIGRKASGGTRRVSRASRTSPRTAGRRRSIFACRVRSASATGGGSI